MSHFKNNGGWLDQNGIDKKGSLRDTEGRNWYKTDFRVVLMTHYDTFFTSEVKIRSLKASGCSNWMK